MDQRAIRPHVVAHRGGSESEADALRQFENGEEGFRGFLQSVALPANELRQ